MNLNRNMDQTNVKSAGIGVGQIANRPERTPDISLHLGILKERVAMLSNGLSALETRLAPVVRRPDQPANHDMNQVTQEARAPLAGAIRETTMEIESLYTQVCRLMESLEL